MKCAICSNQMFYLIFTILISDFIIGQNEESQIPESISNLNKDTLIMTYEFPQVDVIGRKPSLLTRIPGSTYLITSTALNNAKPITGNEMFKKITGVN